MGQVGQVGHGISSALNEKTVMFFLVAIGHPKIVNFCHISWNMLGPLFKMVQYKTVVGVVG